jgi:hypothetical protein
VTPPVLVFDTRPEAQIGVRLAVASLRRHLPAAQVWVAVPDAPEALLRWLRDQPRVVVREAGHHAGMRWEAKPTLLLEALAEVPEVLWFDSDIVATAELGPLVLGDAEDVLVATEETAYGQAQGGAHRTSAWGLPVGRSLPTTVNTGIVRATRHHVGLLEAWRALLATPEFVDAQARPWHERPLHVLSDQEVLTALLGSADFAAVPLRLLRRGTDIAQCFGPAGFTPLERLRDRTLPPLVHAMGHKPWAPPDPAWASSASGRLRTCYDRAHCELEPYGWVAEGYADEVGDDLSWARTRHATARVMAALTRDHPVYRELPLAVVDAAVRTARRRLSIGRFEVAEG